MADLGAHALRFALAFALFGLGAGIHAGGAPGTPLEVVFASLETPDLFKDGAEVVVEGRLAAAGGPFRAEKLFAKCPSKFEARPAPGAAS